MGIGMQMARFGMAIHCLFSFFQIITNTQQLFMTKKQTAVEWLVEQVNADCLNSTFIRPELIDQAKAMHYEQMKDASLCNTTNSVPFAQIFKEQFERYYEKTYGSKDE